MEGNSFFNQLKKKTFFSPKESPTKLRFRNDLTNFAQKIPFFFDVHQDFNRFSFCGAFLPELQLPQVAVGTSVKLRFDFLTVDSEAQKWNQGKQPGSCPVKRVVKNEVFFFCKMTQQFRFRMFFGNFYRKIGFQNNPFKGFLNIIQSGGWCMYKYIGSIYLDGGF